MLLQLFSRHYSTSIFPSFIIEKIFMNKAHCFLRVTLALRSRCQALRLTGGRTGAVLTEKRAERRPSGGEAGGETIGEALARRSTSILKT